MRKDALISLLEKHDKSWRVRLRGENSRITLLRKFINSDEIKLLPENANIALGIFVDYLNKHVTDDEGKEQFFMADFLKQKTPAADLFNEFIKAEEKLPDNLGAFGFLPSEIIDRELLAHSDAGVINTLMQTSSSFYARLHGKNFWLEKFKEAGCSSKVLSQVIDSKMITDYKKLYETFMRFKPSSRRKLQLWDMLCLSGDPRAMSAALRLPDVNKDTKGAKTKYTMLNYAIMAGSMSGIDYALKIGINFDLTGRTRVAYLIQAAAAGNIQVFDYIRGKIISIAGNDPMLMDDLAVQNYLAIARIENKMKMFKHILAIYPSLLAFFNNSTKDGYVDILIQKAIDGEEVEMINHLEELCTEINYALTGSDANQVYSRLAASLGNPAVFDAVWSKFSPFDENDNHNIAFQKALASAILESTPLMVEHIIMKLAGQVTIQLQDVSEKTSESNEMLNILQLAAASGKPEMVICVRKLCAQYNTGITPDSRNEAGKTAFDYAKSDAIKEALRAPLSDLQQPSTKLSPTLK